MVDDLRSQVCLLKGQLKFQHHSTVTADQFAQGWAHKTETTVTVGVNDQEYRHQVIGLSKENQALKEKLHHLESLLRSTQDEKLIIKTMNSVLTDTSETFKQKIYQDRGFYDSLCDQKDREYHRLQQDYNKLIVDHKDVCEKFAELEISKGRGESEASLKRADDQRVIWVKPDYKSFEQPAQRLQRRE